MTSSGGSTGFTGAGAGAGMNGPGPIGRGGKRGGKRGTAPSARTTPQVPARTIRVRAKDFTVRLRCEDNSVLLPERDNRKNLRHRNRQPHPRRHASLKNRTQLPYMIA